MSENKKVGKFYFLNQYDPKLFLFHNGESNSLDFMIDGKIILSFSEKEVKYNGEVVTDNEDIVSGMLQLLEMCGIKLEREK